MPMFLVQRSLLGAVPADLRAMAARLSDVAEAMSAGGRPLSYLYTTYRPSDGRCLCLFRAVDADSVADVNRAADAPVESIDEVAHLIPAQLSYGPGS